MIKQRNRVGAIEFNICMEYGPIGLNLKKKNSRIPCLQNKTKKNIYIKIANDSF